MRRFCLIALLSLPALAPAQENHIWRCIDLQKQPEYSGIQCAPDAEIYVPSRPNAGSYNSDNRRDRRYLDFITKHNQKLEQELEQKSVKGKQNREGNNLNRFKNYSAPAR